MLRLLRPPYRGRMRGGGDRFSVGERIAFYRRRRGLTQRVLADLVGRSEDWVSKIERGERELRRLDVLAAVARALRVTVGDLLGQPVLLEDDDTGSDDVPAVRDALMSPRRLSGVLYQREPAAPVDAGRVAALAEHLWAEFQQGRLGQVVAALPALIGSAQTLEDASTATLQSWAASARVHHLAASTLSKLGEADLAWIAAERAMYAADQSDDPLVLASAARAGTHALLASGRYADALDLGMTAVRWLDAQVRKKSPEAISLLGMLCLRTAAAAARRNDRGTATSLMEQASRAAARLDHDANYWQTAFGPTNVELHRLSVALDLGDVDAVVRAPHIDTHHMPRERAVAHQIDLARAQSLVARDDEALQLLLSAEHIAPQLVRHSTVVRETVRSLHRRSPANGTGASLLFGLAERCRAV